MELKNVVPTYGTEGAPRFVGRQNDAHQIYLPENHLVSQILPHSSDLSIKIKQRNSECWMNIEQFKASVSRIRDPVIARIFGELELDA